MGQKKIVKPKPRKRVAKHPKREARRLRAMNRLRAKQEARAAELAARPETGWYGYLICLGDKVVGRAWSHVQWPSIVVRRADLLNDDFIAAGMTFNAATLRQEGGPYRLATLDAPEARQLLLRKLVCTNQSVF